MATAFAPLVDPDKLDNPSFMNTPAQIQAAQQQGAGKQQWNPVIPKELTADTVEDRLKAEGSGTSFLTSLTAWLGAAKGDFRGLVQLEEQKRRTALAKSMVPEITAVNKLVNTGKWEEASDYVNKLASSYGTRADYLVPYFQQMQADIKKKQEGWKNLQGVYEYYKERIPEDNPRYRTVEALRKAVERRDQISETTLQGILTRDVPHIQYLDNRMIAVDPYSLDITSQNMPQMMSEARVNNFAGNTVAGQNDINTAQVADLMNGRAVKTSSGAVITPDSEQGRKIRTQYNALQPINAALEVAKLVPLEPTQMLQLLKDHNLLEIATRSFGGKAGAVEKALTEHYGRITEQKTAEIKAQVENNPEALRRLGVPVHFDPDRPDQMLTEVQDATLTVDAIKKSGGKIKVIRPEVFDKEIKTAQAGIQSLDLLPDMLSGPDAPKTVGDRLATGVLQRLSARLGYDLSGNATTREQAKTILRTAIEQVENSFGDKLSGQDRVELRNLKAYASGDFATTKQILDAAKQTKFRLSQVIQRSVGINPYFQAPETVQSATPAAKSAKSPASTLAPLIPPQSGVQTAPGATQRTKGIDPALEREIDRAEAAAKAAGVSGGTTAQVPVGGAAKLLAPSVPSAQVQPTEAEQKAAIKKRLDDKLAAKEAQRLGMQAGPDVSATQRPTFPPSGARAPGLSPLQPLQTGDVTHESEQARILAEIAKIRAKELADRMRIQQGVR